MISYPDLLEKFKALLKNNALKFTRQRELILKFLYENEDHYTPEEIYMLLKQQHPDIELRMVDSSALALQSAKKSADLNNLEVGVTASDGLSAVDGRYNWMISNPPFHQGVGTDLDIARQFFSLAPTRLTSRGSLLLVCNRQLPYERWISESFASLEKVAENPEFKVLLARGPRTTSIKKY